MQKIAVFYPKGIYQSYCQSRPVELTTALNGQFSLTIMYRAISLSLLLIEPKS